ncbi:MAG: DUF2508 family protein [Lachnospiraceae bacterium]
MLHLSKKDDSSKYAYSLLLRDLASSKLELESAHASFNFVVDPDLIDSSIYRLNAAQMQYKFLLNKIKSCRFSD